MIRHLLVALMLSITPVWLGASAQAQEVAAVTQQAPVNINSADAETLAASLKGVGSSKAKAIVQHRDDFGPFFSVDDLLEVRGVGQSIIDSNRDRITLE